MKTRGYAAFIVSSNLPDKGTWYRVRLGSFSNKAAAEKLLKQLQAKEGISSFITIE
jgi:cell division septation protein DedD